MCLIFVNILFIIFVLFRRDNKEPVLYRNILYAVKQPDTNEEVVVAKEDLHFHPLDLETKKLVSTFADSQNVDESKFVSQTGHSSVKPR